MMGLFRLSKDYSDWTRNLHLGIGLARAAQSTTNARSLHRDALRHIQNAHVPEKREKAGLGRLEAAVCADIFRTWRHNLAQSDAQCCRSLQVLGDCSNPSQCHRTGHLLIGYFSQLLTPLPLIPSQTWSAQWKATPHHAVTRKTTRRKQTRTDFFLADH